VGAGVTSKVLSAIETNCMTARGKRGSGYTEDKKEPERNNLSKKHLREGSRETARLCRVGKEMPSAGQGGQKKQSVTSKMDTNRRSGKKRQRLREFLNLKNSAGGGKNLGCCGAEPKRKGRRANNHKKGKDGKRSDNY